MASAWERLRAELLSRQAAGDDVAAVWNLAVAEFRSLRPPVEFRYGLWQELFSSWNEVDRGPKPIWFPDAQTTSGTRISQLMHRTGCTDFKSLYMWSICQPDKFWGAVIELLGVDFRQPPTKVLELAAGVEQPNWLLHARLNIVESCFTASADATAIVYSDSAHALRRQSYGELLSLVRRVAAGLRAAGYGPHDRLAIVMPMTPLCVGIYLGIVYAGCAAISIADSFAAPEIQRRLEIARAKGVVCAGKFSRLGTVINLYDRILHAAPPPTIVIDDDDRPTRLKRPEDQAWNDFLPQLELSEPFVAPPQHTINVLFSSGTTGDPKAIPWNQTTPIKCAADGMLHHDLHPRDVVVWPTNLGWMMGPWLIFAALMNKATIGLYHDAPVGEGFGKFVQDAGVTMLGVVPTLVRSWRATACMENCDWSSIRCFSSTGEASQAEDMFYLSALAGHKPIIEYCGGTEIGGGYVTSTLLQPNVPAAFSNAALGSRLVILDEHDQPADEGELFLVPPALGLSTQLLNRDHHATYYSDTPRGPSGETLRRHGDHFRRLAGGYYVAGGRVDDTMNLGGIKVSAAEIEQVLNGLPEIRETAAIAAPDKRGGPDQLVVFVVPAADGGNADQLRTGMNAALKTKLNPLFRVAEVHLVASLPRTQSNKVLRRQLRVQHTTGQQSDRK